MTGKTFSVVYNIADNSAVTKIDLVELHRFILNKISNEFSNMVSNCYYPKIADIYRDLLHMTNSNEKDLRKYSKDKYSKYLSYSTKFQLLHDPYTTLLIIIVQQFLKSKDIAAAQAAFHLFALRYYTNGFHKMTTPAGSRKSICNPEAFQSALDNLSKNHMFVKQKTIPNAILYYSHAIFKLYYQALVKDDAKGLFNMIYRLKTSMMQSIRSFAEKYYEAYEEGHMTKERDDGTQTNDDSHETKLKYKISNITTDMCVYGKVSQEAILQASQLIKFNRRLSTEYAKIISSPQFKEDIETALYILLKDIKDTSQIKNTEFLDHVQKLMSIKVTKQQIYFKRLITNIHDVTITTLNLQTWYNNLSIQSQAVSRNFIAYYLAFYVRTYF
jgi:hypothetical protein